MFARLGAFQCGFDSARVLAIWPLKVGQVLVAELLVLII